MNLGPILPTHEVTRGPATGLRGWVDRVNHATVVVRHTKPGWDYPIYTVVRASAVRPINAR